MKNASSKIRNSKTMNSLIFLFSFLSLFLLLVSCGKKEVKQVSEDSKTAQEAFMLSEEIKNAYIKNNLSTLEKNTTKDGYKDIIESKKIFDSAELSFTPHWVEIDGPTVTLQVSWKGIWTVKGKNIEDRGLAVFVMEGRPLKLAKVLRDNPFRKSE
jgi:hypothetical protein